MIGLNDRDPQVLDFHRLNINTGETQLVQENDQGFREFIFDDDFDARIAIRATSFGEDEVFKKSGDGGWEPFMMIGYEDSLTRLIWPTKLTSLVGFDKTGGVLYLLDSRGRNMASTLIPVNRLSSQKMPVAASSTLCSIPRRTSPKPLLQTTSASSGRIWTIPLLRTWSFYAPS